MPEKYVLNHYLKVQGGAGYLVYGTYAQDGVLAFFWRVRYHPPGTHGYLGHLGGGYPLYTIF